jgi:hypothetical protein
VSGFHPVLNANIRLRIYSNNSRPACLHATAK